MARTEGRIKTSIWNDDEFGAQGPMAKLVYFFVVTQSKLNLCGVISYTPTAWGNRLGLPKEEIDDAVLHLEKERFVYLDMTTEELWIRTLAKNDQVLDKPYMVVAMSKDFCTIQSKHIQERFLDELGPRFVRDLGVRFAKVFGLESSQRLAEPFVDMFNERFDG